MTRRALTLGLACWCVAVLAVACGGGTSGEKAHAATKPAQPTLLELAMTAMGGRARLAAVKSLEIHSHGQDLGRAYRSHVQMRIPGQYRGDIEAADASSTTATANGAVWSSIDGFPCPVQPGEDAALRINWRLIELSLLATLDTRADAELVVSQKGGLDELSVTFKDEPRGPFVLSFHPATHLLTRVDWDATLAGDSRRRSTRVELLDHRPVDGVMVPFHAKCMVDGAAVAENTVDAVAVNVDIPPARFVAPAPVAVAPIIERATAEVVVALREADDADYDRDEQQLSRWIEREGLRRSGPPFRIRPADSRATGSVGMAVIVPPDTRPSTRPGGPGHVATLPGGRTFTTVIRRGEAAAQAAAESAAMARLAAHAAAHDAEPAGPCRIVQWGRDILQLQLPVKRRGA